MTLAADNPEAGTTTRVAAVAVALSTLVGAIGILAFQAWPTVVFVIFAVVIAALARPHPRRAEVIGMAVAMGGSAGLGGVSLYLVSVSPYADATRCIADPCPMLGPTFLLAGAATVIGAALGLAGLVWYVSQRGRARLLLPAVNVLLVGLFPIMLILESQSGNALVEFGGLAAASGALRLVPAHPLLLRAAVFAQIADLATFGFVWQLGQGEQNPIGRWTMEALLGLGPTSASWEAASAAGLILILAKLALVGFLILATPQLGGYKRTVLIAATLLGTVGAAANTLVLLP
jgi:hypothetical protein